MPRENSFSDSDGRSLTPDLDVEVSTPIYTRNPVLPAPALNTTYPPTSNVRSVTSVLSPARSTRTHATTRTPRQVPPIERFKASVRKVIQLHRSASIISRGGVGAEPGIDPRRSSADLTYGHIHQECVIQIIDYSSVRSSVGKMTNREFVDMLNNPAASEREPWAKIRWINIGGISWDIISALAIKYDLHPLAIEDVLHQRDHSRSKADYYTKHLFIRAVCHQLATKEEEILSTLMNNTHDGEDALHVPRAESPEQMDEDLEKKLSFADDEYHVTNGVSRQSTIRFLESQRSSRKHVERTKAETALNSMEAAKRKKLSLEKNEITLTQLKKDERVPVLVKPMYIFFLRDGTVISMHANTNVEFTAPIASRLLQRDTLLRTSADPSLLIQSILDLIVDQAMEVVDAYHAKMRKFEKQVLLKRKMNTVTNLHILSSDLVMHKRTLEPLKTLIYGLRRYDLDRCAALVDPELARSQSTPIVGYMSHKSKIYLADVHDHAEYIINSLDMFASITENLISYTFNMASYEMNEVMRQLTTATIIFLPLTFLSGYFGMNFGQMWSVQNNSDLLFWIIAIPVCAVIIPAFLYKDIKRMKHYMQKKVLAKNAWRKSVKYKQS
jgi:Mg2+ and Co2+ transporter CorA